MTTLASWTGVDDPPAVSSLYLVSDSRFSDAITGNPVTDEGQKIYACRKEPHLFGYCGWVTFPAEVLEKMVGQIDKGLFFANSDPVLQRQTKVIDFLCSELNVTPYKKSAVGFNILHAARDTTNKSEFGLWVMSWSALTGWQTRHVDLPKEHSKLVYEDGSGATALLIEHDAWQSSDVGQTSRAVFSAFCDALTKGTDPHSGGAPQLGGLFRHSGANYFGVVYRKKLYFQGKRVIPPTFPKVPEWFNETFERCDPMTGKRLPHGQPQPRPWPSKPRKRHLP